MGDGHVIPNIVEKIDVANRNNEDHIEILGDGMQTRSFMFIDDCIDALCLIYNRGEDKNIYHIGVDEEVTIQELIKKIQAIKETDLKIISKTAPSGETKRRCPDVNKIRALGFKPNFNLETGLSMIL